MAPMMLLQGARLGARHLRKSDNERNLAVSFTSAGGVKAIVFKLSYDPEQLAVTGVQPGADLPETARVTLSCVPGGDTAIACIVVTSDQEELTGGTVDLASLSVRYIGEVSDDALTLVGVDVNGDDVGSVAPVRISIDGLTLDDDTQRRRPAVESEATPGHRTRVDGGVRISMASLESGIASLPEMKDGEEDGIRVPIRIATGDIAHSALDARGQFVQPELSWKIHPHRRAGETAAGGIRIQAAMLAASDVTGPRISIP
jgi:hypothetical protein